MKRYLFIVSVIVCALLLIVTVISLRLPTDSRAVSQQSPIVIENETDSLKILSAKIDATDQDIIRLKVKNVGTKPVLSYHVRYGNDLAFGIGTRNPDFSPVLQTGETSASDILISARNARTEDGVLRLNLSLCMFEDLSAEGDWNLAQQQREQYDGMVMAFNAARAEMDMLFDAPQLDFATFNTTLDHIRQLSIPAGLTTQQKAGFQFGISDMQLLIKDATRNALRGREAADPDWQRFKNQGARVRSFIEGTSPHTEKR